MSMIRSSATVLAATTISAALTFAAPAASANCANYAKLSLQQLQENSRKQCGQSGPEWKADMKALLAWCGSKSPQDVQAMLNKRKEALSKCGAS